MQPKMYLGIDEVHHFRAKGNFLIFKPKLYNKVKLVNECMEFIGVP